MIILIAILAPVGTLLVVAMLQVFGLEADQGRIKKGFRFVGPILIAYGLGADSVMYVAVGTCALLLSHPRINLPLISRKIDKTLGDGSSNPAQHIT